jgi:aromatase
VWSDVSYGQVHRTEHTITVAAPAEVLYDIIADVTRWPALFGPTVHAIRVGGDDTQERIKLWALANGGVKTWTSRRDLDRSAYRVRFRQEISSPPVASMGGEWIMRARPGGETTVVLEHDYTAVNDDPENVAWIARAVDRNSESELAGLKVAAERLTAADDVVMSFEDAVTIAAPPSEVYDFIYRCDRWPYRLPHVARLDLQEDVPGIQRMVMDTRAPDGSEHTTESWRVCFPSSEIVYKQVAMPKLLAAHTGVWRFEAVPEGTRATSRHTVVLNPDNVTVLGPDATLADARAFVRKALSTNSTTTLNQAKSHAETMERTA